MNSTMLGVSGACIGIGLLGVMKKYIPSSETARATVKAQIARGELADRRYPFLDAGSEIALRADAELHDLVDRLAMYGGFGPDAWEAFVGAAAGAAEFLARKDEIEHRRSIPLLFRGFTQTMLVRLRELRRGIRDAQPAVLQDFDDIVAEVHTFQSDMHHNLWCEAHE